MARIAENSVTTTSSPKAAVGSSNGCKRMAANTVRYSTAIPVPCSISAYWVLRRRSHQPRPSKASAAAATPA
ncbi:hypothetical protein D3C81_2051840 [compost metagenome]